MKNIPPIEILKPKSGDTFVKTFESALLDNHIKGTSQSQRKMRFVMMVKSN